MRWTSHEAGLAVQNRERACPAAANGGVWVWVVTLSGRASDRGRCAMIHATATATAGFSAHVPDRRRQGAIAQFTTSHMRAVQFDTTRANRRHGTTFVLISRSLI